MVTNWIDVDGHGDRRGRGGAWAARPEGAARGIRWKEDGKNLCCSMESHADIVACKGLNRSASGCRCDNGFFPVRMDGGSMCVSCQNDRYNRQSGICEKKMKHSCPSGTRPMFGDDEEDEDTCVIQS